MTLFYMVLGVVFGFVLSRSGATDYDFIQGMFLLTNLQLYGIIASAIAIAAPGIYLLKRRGRLVGGAPLVVTQKPRHRGNLIGGAMFGVGWAMTGMCPGPILVNLGEGKVYAIAALLGTLTGAGVFGVSYPALSERLGLPRLPQIPSNPGS